MFRFKKKVETISKDTAITYDVIAKRYGFLPSDLLKRDLNDFVFDYLIADVAIKHETKQAEKEAKRRSK